MKIQSDLADGADLGLCRQGPDPLQLLLIHDLGVVGMAADSGIAPGIPGGMAGRHFRAVRIKTDVHDVVQHALPDGLLDLGRHQRPVFFCHICVIQVCV